MLIVNGTVNGTTYDNAIVKAEVLMSAFGVPQMNGRPATFRLKPGMGLMRKDRSNPGEVLVSPGKLMNPEFTVTTSSGSLSIRYATNRTPIPGANGLMRYAPKKLGYIKGNSQFFFGPDRIEEYVWAYLHPRNAKSPFARNVQYEYYNAEVDAQAQMDLLNKKNEVMQQVLLMDTEELRLRAAGMSYMVGNKRQAFPGAATAQPAVVRAKLLDALNAHGAAFIDTWNASSDSVLGVVKMAEALNIIEQISVSGGTEWRYSQNYGGARLAFATTGQHPLDVIVGEVTANYNVHYNKLKMLVQQTAGAEPVEPRSNVAPPAPTPPSELPADLFVELCLEKDTISFERTTMTVHLLRKDGSLGKPLFQVKVASNWKAEAVEYFQTEDGLKVREALNKVVAKTEQ